MRVAAYLIVEVIEKLNRFEDDPNDEKKSVLVFLPGLHEIFTFIEFVEETYTREVIREKFEMIPLHSSLCE